jgi:hypothetical protein
MLSQMRLGKLSLVEVAGTKDYRSGIEGWILEALRERGFECESYARRVVA